MPVTVGTFSNVTEVKSTLSSTCLPSKLYQKTKCETALIFISKRTLLELVVDGVKILRIEQEQRVLVGLRLYHTALDLAT